MDKTCKKCGHHHQAPATTQSTPTACPACGAIYAKLEAIAAQGGPIRRPGTAEDFDDALRARARTSQAASATTGNIVLVASALILAAIAAAMYWPDPAAQALRKEREQESEALSACMDALRAKARDPDTASIPPVTASRSGSTYQFQWRRDNALMRMRNGFGLEVPVGGECTADMATRRIVSARLIDNP